MDILKTKTGTKKHMSRIAASLAVATGLLLATAAIADQPTAMAPPVQTDRVYTTDGDFEQPTSGPAAADSVFNWSEIPANQQVPLTRAAFDKGGYQLYDTVGETIVVPFTNQNLYVMKFAESANDTMYFVNTGAVPILYVPRNGYLENASVSGTRWYPFGKDFHPSEPVFLGIAPSYPEFIGLGWYPDEYYYGGYWGRTSFVEAGVFLPTVGLFFEIGGSHYYGWHGYHDYFVGHPDFYRIDYYNRNYYRYADRPYGALHPYGGEGNRYYAHQAFTGTRGPGDFHSFGVNRDRSFGNGHAFRGTAGFSEGGHGFGGNRSIDNNRNFGGERVAEDTRSNGGHAFRGAVDAGQGGRGSSGDHSFGGVRGGDNHAFGNGRGGDDHAFNGGRSNDDHAFGGGTHDYSNTRGNDGAIGGHQSAGQHDFAGARGFNAAHDTDSGHSFSGGRDFHDSARPAQSGGGGQQHGSHDGDQHFRG